MSFVFQVKVIKTKIFSENLIQTEQRLEKYKLYIQYNIVEPVIFDTSLSYKHHNRINLTVHISHQMVLSMYAKPRKRSSAICRPNWFSFEPVLKGIPLLKGIALIWVKASLVKEFPLLTWEDLIQSAMTNLSKLKWNKGGISERKFCT